MGLMPFAVGRRAAWWGCTCALLALNAAVVWPLFGVEYSAYTGSIEGTFLAIARLMAKYPGQWDWWPFWMEGMPFENVYLPFSHWVVALFHGVTGYSAARSFHLVTAAVYCAAPATVFWMMQTLHGRTAVSFAAGMAYSVLSPVAVLIPRIAADTGGPFGLRRLRDLAVYGEAPHLFALALLPIAVVAMVKALEGNSRAWQVGAGVAAAAVVLTNAFGMVDLAVAAICWYAVHRRGWKVLAATGIAVYCAVAPWVSPSLIRGLRANAAVSGGDYRYTPMSWVWLGVFVVGFLAVRRIGGVHRFFLLLAYVYGFVVLAWYGAGVALVPQPSRYELEMDLAVVLALAAVGGAWLEKMPRRARQSAGGAVFGLLGVLLVHSYGEAREQIRALDPEQASEVRIARWLDEHRPGERAFVPGSASLLFNAITDNPQLHGGHEQHGVNQTVPIAAYTIYSGTNAGERDAAISMLWLRALGVRTVAVVGPRSTEVYKPYANWRKFEGLLPEMWREGDDIIYDVPVRRGSLAHVIPRSAVVERRPVHGLDVAEVERYVDALERVDLPEAAFAWTGLRAASVRAPIAPGQVVSIQITYDRGWEAVSGGRRQVLRPDGIGQMVLESTCTGDCEFELRFTGGWERVLTRTLSVLAVVAALAWLRFR